MSALHRHPDAHERPELPGTLDRPKLSSASYYEVLRFHLPSKSDIHSIAKSCGVTSVLLKTKMNGRRVLYNILNKWIELDWSMLQ